jgi:hypothetical protein
MWVYRAPYYTNTVAAIVRMYEIYSDKLLLIIERYQKCDKFGECS